MTAPTHSSPNSANDLSSALAEVIPLLKQRIRWVKETRDDAERHGQTVYMVNLSNHIDHLTNTLKKLEDYVAPAPAPHGGDREAVLRAFCCPKGCIRPDDCWSFKNSLRYPQPDQIEAVLTLLARPASPDTGWRGLASAPKDGTPVEGSELYRYLPYKPEGRRQMKADGRWQRWNGYGWDNSPAPTRWMPADQSPKQSSYDDGGAANG